MCGFDQHFMQPVDIEDLDTFLKSVLDQEE